MVSEDENPLHREVYMVAYYTLNDISDCIFWILESSSYFLA